MASKGNNYGTIARANVLLVPKFDKLGKSIEDATKSVNAGSAGSSIGKRLAASIKSKLGGIGKGISDVLGKVDAGSAGANIGSKLSKGVSAAVVSIGKSVSDSIGKVDATSTGTSIGSKLTSAIGARTTSIGQSISAALSKVDASGAGQSIGSKLASSIKSSLGGIGDAVKGVLSSISASGIGEKISGVASGIGSAAMTAVKGVALGATTAAAAAGAAVVAIGKSALDSYASFEQLSGGIETLFKDTAGKAMQNAQNAFKTAGMSANEYMQTVTGFAGSLRQALGDENAWQMANYADEAVRDMSDNANKMGSNISSIQDAYQGFAKQNFTINYLMSAA